MADILVIDDDVSVAQALRRFFESEGHRTRVAASVGDGLAAVISGAGPTVLVLYHGAAGDPHGESPQKNSAIVDSIRRRAGTEWHIRPLAIDLVGVRVTSPRS